ncbi:SNF2 family N-terminal domain-containing protein [Sporodiniella umbellata]|nr:SNF2 family N-terminal domain-containing protein [Sporodiniella umbellata]
MEDSQDVFCENHTHHLSVLLQKIQVLLYSGATIESSTDLSELLASMTHIIEEPQDFAVEKAEALMSPFPVFFTNNQLLELKLQIMAYKLISKDKPITFELQEDILGFTNGENSYCLEAESTQKERMVQNENLTKETTVVEKGKVSTEIQLSSHQLKKLEWMVSLYNNHANGLIENESSSEKLILTVSFITYLIETKKFTEPFLIIIHSLLISKWSREFEKQAPNIQKEVYRGRAQDKSKTSLKIQKKSDFQVLLTSSVLAVAKESLLVKRKWSYIIIDEENSARTYNRKLYAVIRKNYQTERRLILSENLCQNTNELWAVSNFLLPRIFKTDYDFDKWFRIPFKNLLVLDSKLTNEEENRVSSVLCLLIEPFVLKKSTEVTDLYKGTPDDSSNKSTDLFVDNNTFGSPFENKRKLEKLHQNNLTPKKKYKSLLSQRSSSGTDSENASNLVGRRDSTIGLYEPSMYAHSLFETLVSFYEEINQYSIKDSKTNLEHRPCATLSSPVDKDLYPSYYEMFVEPICMQIIKERIYSGHYRSIQEFSSDFTLMIENTKRFYEKGSMIYQDAETIQEIMNQMINSYTSSLHNQELIKNL